MAVNAEVSVVKAMPGSAFLSFSNRPLSSAAMCCASAALPPFPASSTLLPLFNAAQTIWHAVSISSVSESITFCISSWCAISSSFIISFKFRILSRDLLTSAIFHIIYDLVYSCGNTSHTSYHDGRSMVGQLASFLNRKAEGRKVGDGRNNSVARARNVKHFGRFYRQQFGGLLGNHCYAIF